MKLAFFLAAFSLIFIRVYFKNWWHGPHVPGKVSITVKSDDDYERVQYAGRISFSPDEKRIEHMSPGAYIRYRHNSTRFSAESDLKGVITYDTPGKDNMAEAIHEMIAFGYDAKARMERVFEHGGDSALLQAIPQLRSSAASELYLQQLLRNEVITDQVLNGILSYINRQGDNEKRKLLELLMNKTCLNTGQWPAVEQAISLIHSTPDRSAMESLAEEKQQLK